MRVISGIHGGRNIVVPSNFNARPTTDFAKEALFNILAGRFSWADVEALDLFAGSGSIGYEFVSRGAKRVDIVEQNNRYCEFVKKTAQALNMTQIYVHNQNAFAYINRCSQQYDIIFADPPYALDGIENLPDITLAKTLLKANGWFILEHSSQHSFEQHPHFAQHRRYGNVNFTIFTA
jgi:16S rRNA (guanine(966)-N(2))-methyltransferase RsmD